MAPCCWRAIGRTGYVTRPVSFTRRRPRCGVSHPSSQDGTPRLHPSHSTEIFRRLPYPAVHLTKVYCDDLADHFSSWHGGLSIRVHARWPIEMFVSLEAIALTRGGGHAPICHCLHSRGHDDVARGHGVCPIEGHLQRLRGTLREERIRSRCRQSNPQPVYARLLGGI